MRVEGQVAVVTGAAGGIGAGLARRFAAEGAAGVVVADLDLQAAQAVADSIGPSALAVQCDVAEEGDIQKLVETAVHRFGRIDIYFSNAGIPPQGGGFEAPDKVWSSMWSIHVMAHVWAARAVLPEMARRGHGFFAVTSSAAGLLNIVESAPYAATKHAAVAVAEWARIAYGRQGVVVACLCPQAVESGMTKNGAGSAGGDAMLTPQDVAQTVVEAMDRETFLILTHPQTADYVDAKVGDYDRWLGGMQKVFATYWANRQDQHHAQEQQ